MKSVENKLYIYGITFILAACSIVYELLLAQTVSFFAAGTVTWYTLILGVYLGSMGVGALFFNRIFKAGNDWKSLIRVELLLSMIGGTAVIFIHILHMIVSYVWIRNQFHDMSWLFYGVIFLAVIAIGLLTGCELPLLLRIARSQSDSKSITNRVLSIDYFGSLFGALLFPLVLLVHFELITIGIIMGMVNLAVAGYLQVRQKQQSFQLTLTTMVFGLYVICLLLGGSIEQYFLKKYYYYQQNSENFTALLKNNKDWPEVNRVSSPYQKIDMVYYPPEDNVFDELVFAYMPKFQQIPNFPRGYVLFIDGFYQFLVDIEDIYHEYFTHVPIILNNRVPRNVLVLGAGDGMLVRELLKYTEVEKITLVEIDAKMVEMARDNQVLKYVNQDAFSDSRVNVIIQDAFHFLRSSPEQYDAIYMDFPRVKDYNLSKLYSVEFFQSVHRHLKEDGFAALDAAEIVDFFKENYWGIYYSTLKKAGFSTIIPYFSTLESDNPKAIKLLSPMFTESSQLNVTEEGSSEPTYVMGREAIIKRVLGDFVKDHQNSFILVRKDNKSLNPKFKNFGVDYRVITQQRFGLTLQQPVGLPFRYVPSLVNSIMKPTLPQQGRKWRVRVPY